MTKTEIEARYYELHNRLADEQGRLGAWRADEAFDLVFDAEEQEEFKWLSGVINEPYAHASLWAGE